MSLAYEFFREKNKIQKEMRRKKILLFFTIFRFFSHTKSFDSVASAPNRHLYSPKKRNNNKEKKTANMENDFLSHKQTTPKDGVSSEKLSNHKVKKNENVLHTISKKKTRKN